MSKGIKAVNRRSFIKGGASASIVGAATCFGASAIAAEAPSSKGSDSSTLDGQESSDCVLAASLAEEAAFRGVAVEDGGETAEYDVAVIGCGASGLCAALAAAQEGVRVVIVEKTNITGGMSNLSRMVAGAGSALQAEMGRQIAIDDLYAIMHDHFNNTNNLPLVRNILDASGENIDWLVANGVGMIAEPEELNLQWGLPRVQEKCAHMMTGSTREAVTAERVTEGNLSGLLVTFLEDYAGTLLLETRAVRLLGEEGSGEVTGVICKTADGSQLTINAKAIILAAGSWDANTSYFTDVLAGFNHYTKNSGGVTNDSGDGVYLAEQVGGYRWITTPVWHQVYYAYPDGTVNWDLTNEEDQASLRYNPEFIWVNDEGVRFCDEGCIGAFAQRGSAVFSQGGSAWVIFDRAALEDIEANGTNGAVASINAMEAGSGKLSEIENLVAAGAVLAADSIEELAKTAGFDSDEFIQTVAVYNEAVEVGNDTQFSKDASYLTYPIATAPFYAIRLIANNEGGAIAGVRVNKDLRVYDRNTGKPFANLFAVGQNSSGFFGYGSYVDIMGMTMGYATCSGRLAGKAAAALIG